MEVVSDSDYSAEELASMGVWQALTFGPALISDNAVVVDTNTEVDRAKTSNPRTAIGVIDANHFVFVVSDGRTSESEGLSLYELANFMQDLGVSTAYELPSPITSEMVSTIPCGIVRHVHSAATPSGKTLRHTCKRFRCACGAWELTPCIFYVP